MSSTSVLIISKFLFIIACARGTQIDGDVHRSKRQLLFPNSTLLQFLFIIACAKGTEIDGEVHRSKRLLFPNSTLLQFNFGIGTPTPAAHINLNWAIQANFQLPWNRSQIPVDILHANAGYTGLSKKRDVEEDRGYENDSRLYHLYKYMEWILNGFGHNGTMCVLRTLCQLGAEPLEAYDEEDVLHDIAAFVLNPKNDAEYTEYKDEIHPYIEAYEHGQDLRDCAAIYNSCGVPLLDYFSKQHSSSQNMLT